MQFDHLWKPGTGGLDPLAGTALPRCCRRLGAASQESQQKCCTFDAA